MQAQKQAQALQFAGGQAHRLVLALEGEGVTVGNVLRLAFPRHAIGLEHGIAEDQ